MEEYENLIEAISRYQSAVQEYEQRTTDGEYPPHMVYELAMLNVATAFLDAIGIPNPRRAEEIIEEVRTLREFYRKNRKHISESLRLEIYARDNFACKNCGATERLTIDHIKPIVKGGTNEWDNLQTLCSPCNSRKSDS